jgi:hypothetical protein
MTAFRHMCSALVLSASIAGAGSAWTQTPAPPVMPGMTMPGQNASGAYTTPPAGRMPSPKGAYVYIGWPTDGAVIHSTRFKVWFGTRNFGVAPAGTFVPNTGHHHLLIDVDLPPFDQPIPNDKQHLHFGGGQTEAVIELPPGKHTLQLLMADGRHVPHDPPLYSRKITIYVRPE